MAADRAGRFHELDPSWHLMQIAGLGVSNLGRRSRGVTAWMPRQPRIQSPALAACRLTARLCFRWTVAAMGKCKNSRKLYAWCSPSPAVWRQSGLAFSGHSATLA